MFRILKICRVKPLAQEHAGFAPVPEALVKQRLYLSNSSHATASEQDM